MDTIRQLLEDPVLKYPFVIGATLVVLFLLVLVRDESRAMRLWSIPGPRRWPIMGNIPDLTSEPWLRFYRFYQKYGSIYKIFIWGKPMVVISDPGLVKEVFRTRAGDFRKDNWSYSFFKPILGEGMVTSEGPTWKKQRDMLSPALQSKAVGDLLPVFKRAASRLNDEWRNRINSDGSLYVELDHTFRAVTLEVISEVSLGLSPKDASRLPRLFEEVIDELNQRMFQPWRAFLPLEIEHQKRLRLLNSLVGELIENRKKEYAENEGQPADNGRVRDLLDVMMQSDHAFSDLQTADQLKTMLLAGHETSSMMLTWAVYLLCRHPEALQRAREEVDRALENVPDKSPENLDMATVDSLEYLENVLNEALRVYTPVPVLAKSSAKTQELGGHTIPKGTRILVSCWSLHRSKELWGDDADEFRPDRHLRQNRMKQYPFTFIPFSVGQRDCIGRHLAIKEAKVIMINLLANFDLTLAPGQEDVPTDSYVIPVRPQDGIFMTVRQRTAASTS